MSMNKRQANKNAKRKGISYLAGLIGSLIPGIGISASVYYFRKKRQYKSQATANNQTVVQYIETDLKNKIANISSLSEYDLASLAVDLNAFFKADRYFRKGWVIEGYWDAYDQCSSKTQLGLDAASKW
jgi:hypothetical protein